MDESVAKHLEQPAQLDEPAKRLLRAADLIEGSGLWCGRGYSGGYCILTALIAADGRRSVLGPEGDTAFYRVMAAIGITRERVDGGCRQLYDWNDAHSKDEVVAKLRAAALGG